MENEYLGQNPQCFVGIIGFHRKTLNASINTFHFHEFRLLYFKTAVTTFSIVVPSSRGSSRRKSLIARIAFFFSLGLGSNPNRFVKFMLFATKWHFMDPEVVVEVGGHHLEGLEGKEEEGEAIRLVQEVEDEVAFNAAEGNPYSTAPE